MIVLKKNETKTIPSRWQNEIPKYSSPKNKQVDSSPKNKQVAVVIIDANNIPKAVLAQLRASLKVGKNRLRVPTELKRKIVYNMNPPIATIATINTTPEHINHIFYDTVEWTVFIGYFYHNPTNAYYGVVMR